MDAERAATQGWILARPSADACLEAARGSFNARYQVRQEAERAAFQGWMLAASSERAGEMR